MVDTRDFELLLSNTWLERLEELANMGGTCPSCGSTDTHRVQVMVGDKVVRTYFECNKCGNVW